MSKKHVTTPVNEIDETVKANISFIEKHQKALVWACGSVLAIVIASLLAYQYVYTPRVEKAAEAVAAAQTMFQNGEFEKALNGDGQKAGFLQIANEYSCTPSANLAKLYAGLCYAQTGKYEDAVKMLEKYSGCGDEMISNAAIAALGNCYVETGNTEKGAELLKKAATKADNNSLSPIFLMQAGQLYETLGKNDAAIQCYETIKSKYPQTMQGNEVDKYIERLK